MPGNAEFGKRIQELRKKKMETDPSYSLRQFAAKVGISPKQYQMSRKEDAARP